MEYFVRLFTGPDLVSRERQVNKTVVLRSEKENKIHYTRIHRYTAQQLGQRK